MNTCSHQHGPGERNRYLKIGAISLFTFLGEILASFLTNSLALRTDAFHTLSDSLEGFMNASIAHRARYLSDSVPLRKIGFALSLILIGTSSIFMLFEARNRLASLELEPFSLWAIGAALFALSMNLWQFRIHREAPDHHHNHTYQGQLLHLTLDIGASLAAIAGTALSSLAEIPKADAWAALAIIGFIWFRIWQGYDTVWGKKIAPKTHWHCHH